MLIKNILKVVGLIGIALVFWYLREASGAHTAVEKTVPPTNPVSATTSPSTTQAKVPINIDPKDVVRGMTIQVGYTANGIDSYLNMIDEIAALGANTVCFSTAGYQEHAGSSSLMLDIRKCPSKPQFAKLIERAKSHNMKVALLPLVLLSNPRGNEWRGVIQPDDWDEWFASYLAFIKYFAEVSAENDVEMMAIGAELVSTESFDKRWHNIIREIRRVYHGKLFYSANWDHYRQVSFWDQLDIVGMTTYHKLSDQEDPPLDTLLTNWSGIRSEILAWQKTAGKPILFTEVGWCSQLGASIEAWNYYRHTQPSEAGLEEQKKCYEAFIQTWSGQPAVAGALWWEWTPGSGGPNDYGYTPKNKPAEKVLRDWFRAAQRLSDNSAEARR